MFSKANKTSSHNHVSPSIIGANCSLTGDIVSDGEVHIDGKVIGDVRCAVLVIGEDGGVTGEINAETVRVLGAVTGQITARAVELAKTAHILGDITHDSLAVEAGAYVDGRFNRLRPDVPASGENTLLTRVTGNIDRGEHPADDGATPPAANLIMLGN
jgi:cytoskeletal protein CcmA (bactofilin family)